MEITLLEGDRAPPRRVGVQRAHYHQRGIHARRRQTCVARLEQRWRQLREAGDGLVVALGAETGGADPMDDVD